MRPFLRILKTKQFHQFGKFVPLSCLCVGAGGVTIARSSIDTNDKYANTTAADSFHYLRNPERTVSEGSDIEDEIGGFDETGMESSLVTDPSDIENQIYERTSFKAKWIAIVLNEIQNMRENAKQQQQLQNNTDNDDNNTSNYSHSYFSYFSYFENILTLFWKIIRNNTDVMAEFLLIVAGSLISGIIYYRRRQYNRALWFKKHFYSTINVSINSLNIKYNTKLLNITKKSLSNVTDIDPNAININVNARTLMSCEINDLIPNQEGAKRLKRAAMNVALADEVRNLFNYSNYNINENNFENINVGCCKDSLIRMDKNTFTIVNNYLRNAISGLCAPWFIARDINLNIGDNQSKSGIIESNYIFAMCVESGIENETKKIRVIVIKKDELLWLVENLHFLTQNGLNCLDTDSLKHEWYPIRFNTLLDIAREYSFKDKRQNWDVTPIPRFEEIELVAPDMSLYSQTLKYNNAD